MAYTTQAKVLAELGVASSTVTGSSVPSSSDITTWISEAESEIDRVSGRVWESTAITSTDYEYHDYDGSGYIFLKNVPVISIQSIEYETKGVGVVTSANAVWSSLTEGRGTDAHYLLYKDTGVVDFHKNNDNKHPKAGQQNIRVTYTHGQSTVPTYITRLATLIVAERYMKSFVNASTSREGGSVSVGTISVSDPTNFSINRMMGLQSEKNSLMKSLAGTTKTFMPIFGWG